jgi:hypothetical protein
VDADQMQQQRAARRVMARDAVAHARHGCTAYRFGRRGAPAVAGSDVDRRPLKRAVPGRSSAPLPSPYGRRGSRPGRRSPAMCPRARWPTGVVAGAAACFFDLGLADRCIGLALIGPRMRCGLAGMQSPATAWRVIRRRLCRRGSRRPFARGGRPQTRSDT